MKYEKITEQIINVFFKVYKALGYGFLEKVYENALLIELREMGFRVEKQKRIQVYYKNCVVGDYCADLIVENEIICELKANECLSAENESQLLNYLRATNFEVGLILNFGKRPEIKRKVYDNDKKLWKTSAISEIGI